MNKIDEHKSLAWNFILKTTSLDDENWVLSRAIHAIIRDGEFWHSEVRKRQDTINKLRKSLKAQYKRLTTCPCGGTIIGGCSRCG